MMYGHEHKDHYNGVGKILRRTDTINRQAAIDVVSSALRKWSDMPGWRDDKIVEAVINLSPAQPKKGKWICNSIETIKCDQCGCVVKDYWNWCGFKYCPNCGGDMRGEEDDNI